MQKTKLALISTLVAAALPTMAAGNLNVYNWNDYIGPDTIANFKKTFDVKVKYDNYDSNETLQAKVMTGKSGYDLVHPALEFAARQLEAGIYQKIDKAQIPNYGNLNKDILEKMKVADPNNEYLVPYMWGTTAFGINVDKVKAALGTEPMPDDMWELMFNPKYTSKLKSCGITMFDAGSDVFAMVNIYAGRPANDYSKESLEESLKVLKAVRKDVRTFNTAPIDMLANGDSCVSMSYNGDTFIARDRAASAKKKQNIDYIIPKKGTILWIDVMAMPKDGKNTENAHKWVNNILDPKVSADISNAVNYASPNTAALQFVKKELAGNPKVFMTSEDLKTLQPKKPISSETQRAITKAFNAFKSAK